MGLFQLLTLTFVIASITASRAPLCLQPLQHTSDTGSSLNCLCPVLGSPTIIDNLNPDNTGVERLVIFFYRIVGTGQIIRFIPGKELQHRIPDFPEEYGTVKDISHHPSFKNMFENSASKDTRDTLSNDHASHPEAHSNKEPHRVVVVVNGQLRELNIAPEKDRNDIHGNSELPPWLIPVDEDSGNHIPHIEMEPYPHHKPYESNPSIEVTKEDTIEDHSIGVTKEDLTKEDLTKKDLTKEDLTKEDLTREDLTREDVTREDLTREDLTKEDLTKEDLTNEDQTREDLTKEDLTKEDLTKEDLTKEDLTKEENSDKPSVENENSFYDSSSHQHPSPNSESPEGNLEEHPTSNEKELNKNENDNTSGPFNPNVDDPQNSSENPQNSEDVTPTEKKILVPQKDHHGRIVGWTSQTITIYRESNKHPHHLNTVHPFAQKELLKVLKPNVRPLSHNDMNENYENIPSFDYWLKEQLNITTINGNKIPTTSDDITALHTEIRNVLLQNGLMVTKHGTLIDGQGQESSLDNLKLRPILIGKSISYNRFLKHIDLAAFKIPSNSQFLEGLLLTMIKPAKILGIVPLTITSPPHKVGPEHDNSQPAEQKALLKILPISQVVAFRKYSQAKKARFTGSQGLGPKPTLISQRSSPKVALIRQRSGPKVALISRNNQHMTDSKRRQGFSKKAEKESDYWARWRDFGKPTKTKHRTNEEVPDFRIIGGISATVSGTPLLNRGRSGYVALTHPLS